MFVSGIHKAPSNRKRDEKGKGSNSNDKVFVEFFSGPFIQMLELLETELENTFEGVRLNLKGELEGECITGSTVSSFSLEALETLPHSVQNRFELSLTIYCSLEVANDIEFWGHKTLFLFHEQNNDWFITCQGQRAKIDSTLPISWKRTVLRYMYFKIMDNFNENY